MTAIKWLVGLLAVVGVLSTTVWAQNWVVQNGVARLSGGFVLDAGARGVDLPGSDFNAIASFRGDTTNTLFGLHFQDTGADADCETPGSGCGLLTFLDGIYEYRIGDGSSYVSTGYFDRTGFAVLDNAIGTGPVAGPGFLAGHNTSGDGAAGVLILDTRAGTSHCLWVDTTGALRIHTDCPTEDDSVSDTAGVVVGAQTTP